MTGSNEDRIVFESYDSALKWAMNNDWVNGKPDPNNKVITVFKCDVCGEYWWGSHSSKHCPKCRVAVSHEQTKRSRERQRMKKMMENEARGAKGYIGYTRIAYCDMDQKFQLSMKAVLKAEKIEAENKKLLAWNEEHTCQFADCGGRSVQCFNCMRGKSYAGFTNLSDRRCPDNPISPTGARYLQRTKNWKNPDGTKCSSGIKTIDVADNMPQQLKVQLVERMRKMGRELYLWSNGHLDITPDPDSDC